MFYRIYEGTRYMGGSDEKAFAIAAAKNRAKEWGTTVKVTEIPDQEAERAGRPERTEYFYSDGSSSGMTELDELVISLFGTELVMIYRDFATLQTKCLPQDAPLMKAVTYLWEKSLMEKSEVADKLLKAVNRRMTVAQAAEHQRQTERNAQNWKSIQKTNDLDVSLVMNTRTPALWEYAAITNCGTQVPLAFFSNECEVWKFMALNHYRCADGGVIRLLTD